MSDSRAPSLSEHLREIRAMDRYRDQRARKQQEANRSAIDGNAINQQANNAVRGGAMPTAQTRVDSHTSPADLKIAANRANRPAGPMDGLPFQPAGVQVTAPPPAWVGQHAGSDADRAIDASRHAGNGDIFNKSASAQASKDRATRAAANGAPAAAAGRGRVLPDSVGNTLFGDAPGAVTAGATTQTPYGTVSSRNAAPGEPLTAANPLGDLENGQTGVGRAAPFDMAGAHAALFKSHPEIWTAGSPQNLAFLAHAQKFGHQSAYENAPELMKTLPSTTGGQTGGMAKNDIQGNAAPKDQLESAQHARVVAMQPPEPAAPDAPQFSGSPVVNAGRALVAKVKGTQGANPADWIANFFTGNGKPSTSTDPIVTAPAAAPATVSAPEPTKTPLGSTTMNESPLDAFAKSPEDDEFKKKLSFSGFSDGK